MLQSRSRMTWRIGLYVLLGMSCLIAVYAWARSSGDGGAIEVSSRAELLEELGDAREGVTLRLAPGDYGSVNLVGVGKSLPAGERITITSADPCNRATFARMWLTDSANLILRDLRFENNRFFARPADKILRPDGGVRHMDLLRTDDSSALTIVDNVFAGATVEVPGSHPLNGFPHGIGWMGRNVSDVVFQSNRVENLFKGLSLRNTKSLRIAANLITDYRSDALFLWDVEDLTVESNAFTYPRPYVLQRGAGDHPDFIQIKNVDGGLIQNNYMVVGPDAGASQGIFPGPARNLTVRNNIIISRMVNGIAFREIADSEIANNLVLRAEDPIGGRRDMDGKKLPEAGPRIRIDPASSNVLMRGNAASYDGRRGGRRRANEIAVSTLAQAQPFVRIGSDGPIPTQADGYRRIGDILFNEDSLATAGIDAEAFGFLDGAEPGADARCSATT